jgi:hypothetical protein
MICNFNSTPRSVRLIILAISALVFPSSFQAKIC